MQAGAMTIHGPEVVGVRGDVREEMGTTHG